jgi:class 3 adenylate cyclase
MSETLRNILVTEVLPPPDIGPQEAQRRTAQHQKRVTALVTRRAGEVLIRVGRGCVAVLPGPAEALSTARELLTQPLRLESAPARIRAAVHLGEVHPDRPAIAQPGVTAARKLLEAADPNEILLSKSAHEALADAHLSVTPLSGPGDAPGELTGYRLLINPVDLDLAAGPARRPVSGWLMAGGVLLASAAILSALTAALLL